MNTSVKFYLYRQKEKCIENEFFNETLLSSLSKTNLPIAHNGGSGGYLEFVFRNAAEKIFGLQVDELEYIPNRLDLFVST